jgi:hypothetical protein
MGTDQFHWCMNWIIKAKGEKGDALLERRSYPLAVDSEPVIRHLRETYAFKKAFTLSDFNPTSLARSPEVRYLRTVIVTK